MRRLRTAVALFCLAIALLSSSATAQAQTAPQLTSTIQAITLENGGVLFVQGVTLPDVAWVDFLPSGGINLISSAGFTQTLVPYFIGDPLGVIWLPTPDPQPITSEPTKSRMKATDSHSKN